VWRKVNREMIEGKSEHTRREIEQLFHTHAACRGNTLPFISSITAEPSDIINMNVL
jgi:hypothetical protein